MTVGIGSAVSHVPLRCHNLLFAFRGRQANDALGEMLRTAKGTPGGSATFGLDSLGDIAYDTKFKVQRFDVIKVNSMNHLY
jgi:hypothetical protein